MFVCACVRKSVGTFLFYTGFLSVETEWLSRLIQQSVLSGTLCLALALQRGTPGTQRNKGAGLTPLIGVCEGSRAVLHTW